MQIGSIGKQIRTSVGGTVLLSHCEADNEIMMQRGAVVQKICDVVNAECQSAFGDRIVSLILTGSAARGEATIVNSGNVWKVLGDVEFLVVVKPTARPADSACADAVKRDSAEKLCSQAIIVAIDFGLVDLSYLKKLPRHIFSYELRVCGKVVSGDPCVLRLIPQFATRDISREDAWRLVCNRMVEQLGFADDLESSPIQLTPRLHYATVKCYLDMATSYLVFVKNYAPSYRERSQNLSALAENAAGEVPFPLKEFSARVAECTSWKLSGEDGGFGRRVELWHEAIDFMRQLWRWEVMQLVDTTGDFSDAEMWRSLSKKLTLWQKLRGWASVVKRSGGLSSWRNWPRWLRLGLCATPRYWIYRAGMEISFKLPELVTPQAEGTPIALDYLHLASVLPMCKMEARPENNAWRHLAGEIAENYWKYLADTRA